MVGNVFDVDFFDVVVGRKNFRDVVVIRVDVFVGQAGDSVSFDHELNFVQSHVHQRTVGRHGRNLRDVDARDDQKFVEGSAGAIAADRAENLVRKVERACDEFLVDGHNCLRDVDSTLAASGIARFNGHALEDLFADVQPAMKEIVQADRVAVAVDFVVNGNIQSRHFTRPVHVAKINTFKRVLPQDDVEAVI